MKKLIFNILLISSTLSIACTGYMIYDHIILIKNYNGLYQRIQEMKNDSILYKNQIIKLTKENQWRPNHK